MIRQIQARGCIEACRKDNCPTAIVDARELQVDFDTTALFRAGVDAASMNRFGLCVALVELPVEMSLGSSIALIAIQDVERRQPGLAADHPAFVRGLELVGCVEAADVQFELVPEAVKHR